MSKYVMWGTYCEDVLEKRAPHRQAHLDGLAIQKQAGVLVTIGPTKDLTKVFGIYEAEDESSVRQLIESTPTGKTASGLSTMYANGFKLFKAYKRSAGGKTLKQLTSHLSAAGTQQVVY